MAFCRPPVDKVMPRHTAGSMRDGEKLKFSANLLAVTGASRFSHGRRANNLKVRRVRDLNLFKGIDVQQLDRLHGLWYASDEKQSADPR